ncbi:MAG: hypothetical protein ACKVWR_18230 [Acidimicrobiales bacterium]
MAGNALIVSQDGGVLTLTNNDPPINRMTLEYMDAVEETVNAAATDRSVRVLVFTAAGEEELSAMPPVAVAGVLRCVVGAGAPPLEEALDVEREAVRACSGTRDRLEGMAAFLEKRRPIFTGE